MRTGSAPNVLAIVGSAVAITVESRLCMNIALATITAVRRVSPLVRGLAAGREALIDRPSVAPARRLTKERFALRGAGQRIALRRWVPCCVVLGVVRRAVPLLWQQH